MFPKEWAPPCGSWCTKKYANLVQIPWRIFCKKGCDADGETWEECQEECNEICFKDPVLKDHEWSYYIDRSPGHDNYSLFDIPKERVEAVRPKRPPKPTAVEPKPHVEPNAAPDDLPSTSA
ncbi:hypothetical protein OPV22_012197 [Ensete ventricosum]|uniref:Uncharacterized protein n=1 Tax=Ensete ventricosum TaxID=4639 RepID=A0AAV8R108_ENSVE|nr:hypothetical protein OPV22_012197 [Ensete ventricosum]